MGLTWEKMIEMEPGLLYLHKDILREKEKASGKSYCANFAWYRQYKPRLLRLVGYMAQNEALATTEAYDIAYQKLYNELPNCKNCGCL